MTSISLRSGKAMLLFGGIVVLFCSIFQSLLSSWIPPFPAVLTTGLGLTALGGACLPPGIFYLSASKPSGFSFVYNLMFAIAPMKVTHLLNTFESGAILGDQIHMSEYRVNQGWQMAVRNLSNIAPLIILDARIITPNVRKEVQFVINSENRLKTIFITEEDGSSPAFSYLESLNDGCIFTLPPKAAIESLQGIGWRSIIHGKKAINELIESGLIR